MKSNNKILFYGLFSLLISCKSLVSVIVPEIIDMKESTMMNGEQQYKIWIDKSLIVGIVSDNYIGLDSLSEMLNELKLECDTSLSIRTEIGIPKSLSNFTFLKKMDETPVSQENSHELEKLRERYGNSFGPGIFYESGKILGVLSNAITVQFEQRISQERIDEILKSIKATKIVKIRENEYHVECPKSWGYKVLDVSKVLFELKEVRYVENQYRVIKSFN